jgi:hypothetical protein
MVDLYGATMIQPDQSRVQRQGKQAFLQASASASGQRC